MNSERVGGNNRRGAEKPDWLKERERDLARKKKIGEFAVGLAAMAIVGMVLSHSARTSEIMENEERAKNVKKIEAEGIIFHDGVNVRREPFVGNTEPNQLASIGEEGEQVAVDYDGDAYYYNNHNDANGGWYGFEAVELADELLEDGYIAEMDAGRLKSDEKSGDGIVWLNENYVTVIEADLVDQESAGE